MLRHSLFFSVLAGLVAIAPLQMAPAPIASIASFSSNGPRALLPRIGPPGDLTQPMPEALRHRHGPVRIHTRRDDGTYVSDNWSGYGVSGSNISFASGSWVVPTATCGAGTQYASFWVGIDGFGSGTVEQLGTDSDCQNGVPTYYAWYEFYPQYSYIISSSAIGTIKPGTVMTASVSYAASTGTFTVTISNGSGGSFSTTSTMAASRVSAEWIAEAPSTSSGVQPVTDFGSMTFSTSATANGVSGPVGSFLEPGCTSAACSNAVQIFVMSQSGGNGAQPSSLDSTGTDFSDAFVGSGPAAAPPPPPPPPPSTPPSSPTPTKPTKPSSSNKKHGG